MAVTTTAAVIMGGSALIGAGIGAYSAYQDFDSRRSALRAQQEAESARVAAERQRSAVLFAEEKKQAAQQAQTLTGQATETQTEADISRQIGNANLATNLDSAAGQSRTANQGAASLQGQVAGAVSSVAAKAANSGLKLSGSMATAQAITSNEGNQQVNQAKNSINNALRQTQSGATSSLQAIGSQYDTAMFNKNSLLTKASQLTAAYEEGGSAYNVYQANDVYTGQLGDLQSGLIQQQLDSNAANQGFGLISGAFSGLSAGLSMASSGLSLASSLGGFGSTAFKNSGSALLTGGGGGSWAANHWDFSTTNGLNFGYGFN